ncbi:S24 family peptidase [Methylovorus glucosotrophus]|uniref:S24 family peptidase n=1 Tax=Methylovorus glucosotrophus TaxID=266009 RepID=UPI001331B9A2|nr:S24 family peptidase [Methylovorus glucosotrophus]
MNNLQSRIEFAVVEWQKKNGRPFKRTYLFDYIGAHKLSNVSMPSRATVSLWFNGPTKEISADLNGLVADFFGVDPEWLRTGRPGAINDNAHEGPTLEKFRVAPVVGQAQLGDEGYFVELEYAVGFGDGFIEWPTKDPNAYAVRCVGDSMKPRIRHGEFVVVEPGHQPTPGDDVLVKCLEGRVMVKELLFIRDGQVHLGSVNESHPKITIDQSQIDVMHYVAGIARSPMFKRLIQE